ncbi:uncharacterized protein L199_000618 [Kwoniella botswanensis]|uniref:uncharacterized protein n=1 Tax=Kwoniella botswanensis TaxID=1268659 RepID=UPI00315CC9B4
MYIIHERQCSHVEFQLLRLLTRTNTKEGYFNRLTSYHEHLGTKLPIVKTTKPAVLAIQSKSAIDNEVNQEALRLGFRVDSITFADVTMPLRLVLLGCVKNVGVRVMVKPLVALVCPQSDQYSVFAAIQELAQLVVSQHPKQVLVPYCPGRVIIDYGMDDIKEVLEEMWRMDKNKMTFIQKVS